MFRQITIIGTGLIGGSVGLAVKKHGLARNIVGCDRADILEKAKRAGAIDAGDPDPVTASRGSDVAVLATPVGGILDLLEKLGPVLPKDALLTDVGSTKLQIAERARKIFGSDWQARFLPGHPMAGKEKSGIEHADAELFRDAVWIFTSEPGSPRQGAFVSLAEAIGASPLFLDAERHDRICAWVSHLQQFVSTAMASALVDVQADLGPEVHAIGGRALREMTRIASSPYSMWRDIAFTNSANIESALSALEQNLAHIRENLKTPGLREEFRKANSFRSK